MAAKQNAKYFKCEKCDYSAVTRNSLKIHDNCVHLKLKNFQCSQCSYECLMKSSLKMHTMGVHLKRRDYRCVTRRCPFSKFFNIL
jgi:hypothetical protein